MKLPVNGRFAFNVVPINKIRMSDKNGTFVVEPTYIAVDKNH